MKRFFLLALALMIAPLSALAELHYEIKGKGYIDFPDLDNWHAAFTYSDTWTFVTADNLEEHLDLVMARGDGEAAIRERFARDTLIFEAYSTELPPDACIRVEKYETDFTREVWHLRHWGTGKRAWITAALGNGSEVDYCIYGLQPIGSGGNAGFTGWFTNYPPAGHEGGSMNIHFRNGAMYLISYNVYGRLSGSARFYSNLEEWQMSLGPLNDRSSFRSELLPRPARLTLDTFVPVQAAVGSAVTVTGTVEQGSTLTVTLDGTPVPAQVTAKNTFSVELPMKASGDHEALFTLSREGYQDSVRVVRINADNAWTPMILTARPETYAAAGEQKLAGFTVPGAELTVQLDDAERTAVSVDEAGCFSHTFAVNDSAVHTLRVTAEAPGLMETIYEKTFVASYADGKTAVRIFRQNATDTPMREIIDAPQQHLGEKVEVSLMAREVTFCEQGLRIHCVWNYDHLVARKPWQPDPKKQEEIYVSLVIPGYAQDKVYKGMILSVCATVTGTHLYTPEKGESTEVLELTADYVTYTR